MIINVRPATAQDQQLIARALYAAWQWRHPWDEDAFARHLQAQLPDSYVDDFGFRAGDAGVIAERVDESHPHFAGAAWYRFFSASTGRSGYVAEDVPEVVLAVEAAARRQGVGRRLMHELIDQAVSRGVRALSLHVSSENDVAAGLYRALGFEACGDHEGRGVVMVKALAPPHGQ